MSQHFKEFFVCPHCEKPVVSEDELENHTKAGNQYCGKCGKKIADALAEALAMTNDSTSAVIKQTTKSLGLAFNNTLSNFQDSKERKLESEKTNGAETETNQMPHKWLCVVENDIKERIVSLDLPSPRIKFIFNENEARYLTDLLNQAIQEWK